MRWSTTLKTPAQPMYKSDIVQTQKYPTSQPPTSTRRLRRRCSMTFVSGSLSPRHSNLPSVSIPSSTHTTVSTVWSSPPTGRTSSVGLMTRRSSFGIWLRRRNHGAHPSKVCCRPRSRSDTADLCTTRPSRPIVAMFYPARKTRQFGYGHSRLTPTSSHTKGTTMLCGTWPSLPSACTSPLQPTIEPLASGPQTISTSSEYSLDTLVMSIVLVFTPTEPTWPLGRAITLCGCGTFRRGSVFGYSRGRLRL
mmetsp:Transcript_42211/g.91755  ORF Transcript_42211/g.91755 Transcript_42211/m.91755 type:complete len:250 (-) Transcript_42211:473-1222(-)